MIMTLEILIMTTSFQVFGVNYYLSLGVPKEKLVMGIPEYGRCYTLDDINSNGLLAPASKPGPAGPYIRIPGTLGFNEVTPAPLRSSSCEGTWKNSLLKFVLRRAFFREAVSTSV